MPNQVILTVPAPIVVQVKQVEKTQVTSPAFSAGQSRLAKLLDVNISNQSDGAVLYYNAANGDYEFATIDGGTF
jgi:hypothetical protein